VDDAVFKALAVLPMTGIPNEGITKLPFDIYELLRLIKEEEEKEKGGLPTSLG
jgi:hypothetical protein